MRHVVVGLVIVGHQEGDGHGNGQPVFTLVDAAVVVLDFVAPREREPVKGPSRELGLVADAVVESRPDHALGVFEDPFGLVVEFLGDARLFAIRLALIVQRVDVGSRFAYVPETALAILFSILNELLGMPGVTNEFPGIGSFGDDGSRNRAGDLHQSEVIQDGEWLEGEISGRT